MQPEAIDREAAAHVRLAQGDPAALAEIMREHQAMVFSLALHFLREPSLAEDVAQEVFLQLYQNREPLESPAHLRFWLRKVTCHRSMDAMRHKGRRRTVDLDEASEPATVDSVDDPFLRAWLWRLLGSLPEKPQMALILRFQEDLSYKEIAAVMEIPVNTVKSSMNRGLALLRGKLTRSMRGVREGAWL